MKKYLTILIPILLLIFVGSAFAYEPPLPDKTFYGDANGDQFLMADDVGIHQDYASANFSAGYDTPQPAGPGDRQ